MKRIHFFDYYTLISLLHIATLLISLAQFLREDQRIIFYCVGNDRGRQKFKEQDYEEQDKGYFDLPFEKLAIGDGICEYGVRQRIIKFSFFMFLIIYYLFVFLL